MDLAHLPAIVLLCRGSRCFNAPLIECFGQVKCLREIQNKTHLLRLAAALRHRQHGRDAWPDDGVLPRGADVAAPQGPHFVTPLARRMRRQHGRPERKDGTPSAKEPKNTG